jgi:tape measure domain-containing protein
MTTERLDVVIREDGSRVVKRNIESIGDAAVKTTDLVKKAFAAVVTGAVINQLRQLADQYTNIQNKLRLTTTDQANLNAVFNELQAISTRTRSSLEANAELYAKVSTATKDLGISQKEVLQFTESLNKAIKISGATASEAEGGLRQLAQGLASGTLRGDELNSVLENLPAVADVIAKSLNVTRGELRQMGADGKISADTILTAFREARVELDEKFAKVAPTAAEGFVLLKNQLLETVGVLDQTLGASSGLGSVLGDLTKFLKDATPEIVNFGRALTGNLDPMDEMTAGTKLLASALIIVWGVFKTLGSLLFGTVKAAFETVGKSIGAVAAAVGVLLNGGTISEAFETLKLGIGDVKDTYIATTNEMGEGAVAATSDMFTKLAGVWDKGHRDLQDRAKNAVGTVSTETGPNNTAAKGLSEEELKKQQRELDKVRNALIGVLNQIDPLSGATLEYAKQQEALATAYQKGLITVDQFNQYTERLGQTYREILDPVGKLNREFEEQIELAGMTSREREIESQMLSIQKDLLAQKIVLTDDEARAMRERLILLQQTSEAQAIQDQLLNDSVDARKAYIDQLNEIQRLLADPGSGFTQGDATEALMQSNPDLFEGTQEAMELQVQRYQEMYDRIEELRQRDLISDRTAQQMRAKVDLELFELRLKNTQQFFGNLSSLARSENSKLAKVGQAAALVQATIDGAAAVMKTYASAPYPYNIALAAAQAVASAAQIAQIKGANTAFATGGEFRVGGSGGTDSQMVAFRATPGEKVAVSTPQQVRKGDPNGNGGSAQPVQVAGPTIINVRDPKEVPNAIQSNDGRDAIINVFSDNINTFKQMLQSS